MAHKMPPAILQSSPIDGLETIELTVERAPLLQTFFERNPAYFLATSGEPAGPSDARNEIESLPPADWSFTKKWVVGYADATGSLIAMTNVITDLLATSVYQIGTFIVATDRHGHGDAQAIYSGLEAWSASNGAKWMRLGVVRGNTRAERFWSAQGYVPVRERSGIPMGARLVTVQNMVKPVGGRPIDEYFALVPRDRPEGKSAR
jgi:GNAT superfamily N-acetyltransferase